MGFSIQTLTAVLVSLAQAAEPETGGAAGVAPSPATVTATDLSRLSLEELLAFEIEAATLTKTNVRKIPSKIIVLHSDDLRRRGYRYLIDVLDELPGIQVMRNQEVEWGSQVIVRGIWQNNKVLVLYNGQKITSPENRDFYFGNQAHSLDHVKRIEVIYGPASALYGADAVNAIINIVSKDYDDLQGRLVEASASYGRYNQVDANLSTGFAVGPLKVRLGGAFHRSDGPNLLDEYPRFYSPYTDPGYAQLGGKNDKGVIGGGGAPTFVMPTMSYHLNVLANLGEDTQVQYYRSWTKQTSAVGFGFFCGFGPCLPQFEFSPENYWALSQDNVGLTNTLKLLPSLSLRSHFGFSHQELDEDSQFVNSFFTGWQSFYRDDFKKLRGIRWTLNEQLTYSRDDWGLQVVAGGRFEDVYALTKISTTTGERFDDRYPASYQVNEYIPVPEVNYMSYGAYLQAQYALPFLDGLDVTAGASVDRVWFYQPSFNPRVGLTYAPVDWINARVSYGRAYVTPSPMYKFENFSAGGFPVQPNSVGALPNDRLKSEVYQTVEGGLTFLITKDIVADVSAFWTANDNYMLRHRVATPPFTYLPNFRLARQLVSGTADEPTAFIFTSENGGEVTAFGGEVGVSAQVLSRLKAWANYSLTLGNQKETPALTSGASFERDFLLNQAPHMLKGGVEVEIIDGLFVTPTLVWYSKYNLRPVFNATTNELEDETLAGHFVGNLSIVYEGNIWRAWGNVRNLWNSHYRTPGGTVSELAIRTQPQDPLSFLIGVDVRL